MSFATAHALLVGVGNYANAPHLNVPITAADARAVAAVLCDPQACGYPPEQVVLLSDAAASRAGVLAALDSLAARVGENDTVFLFYAGHGHYGDDGYYLTTHDTRIVGAKVAVGSGMREAELIAKLRAITAKRLLLIVNACHSGELSPVLAPGAEVPSSTPLPPATAAALLGTGEGRVIISACRDKQFAFVGPGPLTLFTQALVDGLQGHGVSSQRGYISVFDLYTHLYYALDDAVPRLIPAAVRQHYGEKQEPELTILKGVGPFAVALYRGATTLGSFESAATPPAGTAVREVNPAYAQAMLRQHQQTIGDNAQVGAAISGDVHGNVTVTQRNESGQRGGIHFGSGNTLGNVNVGDVAGHDINKTEVTHGDRISTGDISGGIAIGDGARSTVRNVNTDGGDYAEGNIDKRQGTFITIEAIRLENNEIETHRLIEQGLSALHAKQYTVAIQCFEKVCQLAPQSPKIGCYLALAYIGGRSPNALHVSDRLYVEKLLLGARDGAWLLPELLLGVIECDYYEYNGKISTNGLILKDLLSRIQKEGILEEEVELLAHIQIKQKTLLRFGLST